MSVSFLFSDEGKSFSLRKPDEDVKVQKVKTWNEIALEFLSEPYDIQPLAQEESFNEIDTARAYEFVAGQGSENWQELRKKVLEDSKLKRKKSKH